MLMLGLVDVWFGVANMFTTPCILCIYIPLSYMGYNVVMYINNIGQSEEQPWPWILQYTKVVTFLGIILAGTVNILVPFWGGRGEYIDTKNTRDGKTYC